MVKIVCMKNNRIALSIDLLFCLGIIPLAIMLLPVDRWITTNVAFLVTLVGYIYVLYFVYRLVCLPRLFMQKKYWQIVGLMIILAAVTEALTHFPMPSERIVDDQNIMAARLNMRKQTIWFFFLIVTGFSLAIELIFELFRQIFSRQALEAEKNKAELALYKAQINSHFLFNTLNTLYALVLSESDKTESAFIKFSNILRYMYTQNGSDLIPAGRELDYIRQYIELQKLRLNHHTKVEVDIQASNNQVLVPSMILITFVENAFKYGTSSDLDSFIHIQIHVDERHLILETENPVMFSQENKKSGIGIVNCRKRLDLLYPDRYELTTIEEAGGIYRVFLKIQLQ